MTFYFIYCVNLKVKFCIFLKEELTLFPLIQVKSHKSEKFTRPHLIFFLSIRFEVLPLDDKLASRYVAYGG